MGFSFVVVLYSSIVEYAFVLSVERRQAEQEFVVAENFAELVSTAALTCLEGGGFDPL